MTRPAHTIASAAVRKLTLVLLAGMLMAISSCADIGSFGHPPLPPVSPSQTYSLPTQELLRRADDAAHRNDPGQALLVNQALLSRQELRPQQRALAAERAARSANQMRRYDQSVDFLRTWASSDPAAKSTWPWHEVYSESMEGLGLNDTLFEHLTAVSANRSYSQELRSNAAMALAERSVRARRPELSYKALHNLYAQAADQSARMNLERGLLSRLQAMPDDQVTPLARPAADAGDSTFPRNIYRLAGLERQAKAGGQQGQDARAALRDFIPKAQLADASLGARLAAADSSAPAAPIAVNGPKPTSTRPASGTKLVLAVPQSGRFAEVGARIISGAAAAQHMLSAKGVSIEVRQINTEQPGWVGELASLPTDFRIVGGPLRAEELKDFSASGQMRDRAVFAFLPALADMREGQDAWRFFSSPRDQVTALLELATSLGLNQLGVLAPSESYGLRMSQVFVEEANRRGLAIVSQGTYTPKAFGEVDGSVRKLVESGNSAIQAAFLPDTLAQAKLMTPYFQYHNGEHLLLMGPELWSQALAKPQDLEASSFHLAVCPGAWWPANPGSATTALRQHLAATGGGEPDFWSALGFDFVRMAATLGALPDGWSANVVNERLSAVRSSDFSLAPINWDSQGVASQQLFVFQPSSAGLKPVDQPTLSKNLQQAQGRHGERMRILATQPPKIKKP